MCKQILNYNTNIRKIQLYKLISFLFCDKRTMFEEKNTGVIICCTYKFSNIISLFLKLNADCHGSWGMGHCQQYNPW